LLNRSQLFAGVKGQQGEQGVNTWGSLEGTLSDQTDLQAELDGKLDYDDDYIIYLAGNSTVTDGGFVYTSGKLTSIDYDDTADVTLNSKTLTYTGDLLTQLVHEFTYNSQVWTVTTALTYTGEVLTGKPTRTINKV